MFLPLIILITTLISNVSTSTAPTDEPLNELKATPNDVHALLFDHCTEMHSTSQPDGTHVSVCTSRVIETDFPFNELLPSWNIDAPAGTGFSVYIRVGRKQNEFWTPFYYLGTWKRFPSNRQKLVQDKNGVVRIDHFQSKNVFDRIQYQIESIGGITISRVALAYSNTLNDPLIAQKHHQPIDAGSKEQWVRRLKVPFRSQATQDEKLRGRLCSPVSVAMVMAYHGIDREMTPVCEAVYDSEYKIYGNWSRAIQGAYNFGVPGYLERFNDWNQVKRYIAAGQPIIASIKIKKGQLHTDATRESTGHLLVVTGFDEDGNVHVNDPAYRFSDRGVTTYSKKDMDNIWFANGGVGYVLQAP
jgi:hypothetical protein